ncbi:MAG: exopolyphosphatase [Paracoccaceae bacterium]
MSPEDRSIATGDLGLGARSFGPPGSRPGHVGGRIGVVDAGSNSVRLVVYEGGARSPSVIFNEKATCALGAGLARTGRLNPEGRARAMAALHRFGAVAEHLGVGTMAGIATAAIREAEDGPAFRDLVEAATGIRLAIATGADEARYAMLGVLFGDPQASGVVADLGGASMELGIVADGAPGQGVTTPLGPLRLEALADPEAEIAERLDAVPEAFRDAGERLILVGGAWRALARADMERRGYPLKVLHEYALSAERAHDLARWAKKRSPSELAALDGVSESRAANLPLTARLLRGLLVALAPREVAISAFGLREGVAYEAMAPGIRAQDPLVAAAREMERVNARAYGFGAELGAWAIAALPPANPREARLMRAAAHLADIAWRTHPDHRVASAWEAATRSNLTGLGHEGRVFLALALAARYRRAKQLARDAPAAGLVDEAAARRAVALGLALRLGCSLSACVPGVLSASRLVDDGERLSLSLDERVAEMAGEDSDKALAQLARHMNRRTGDLIVRRM